MITWELRKINSFKKKCFIYRWLLLSLLIISLSIFVFFDGTMTTVRADDKETTYRLQLSLNATQIDLSENSIKSIQVAAHLLDDENEPIDENDIPVTFMTNGSVFLENSQDVIVVNTVDGVAVAHLKPPQGEAMVRISARLEDNGGFETTDFIRFTTGSSDAGDSPSNSGNQNPLNIPQVDFGGVMGVLETNSFVSGLAYPLVLVTIVSLLAAGVILFIRRIFSWESKKSLSAEIGLFTKLQAAFIGLIGAVVTRSWLRRVDEHEVTMHPLRRRILSLLERRGIVHLRELQRELDCSMSTLLWHLQVLEDFNYVKSVKHGQYIAYHLSEYKPSRDTLKVYFGLLNEKARKIIELMLSEQRMVSTKEIARMTNLERANIRYHLKKLADLGIIVQRKEFDPPRYALHPKYLQFVKEHLNADLHFTRHQDLIDFDSMQAPSLNK